MQTKNGNVVRGNEFYRDYFEQIIFGLKCAIIFMAIVVFIILYQITHRSLPYFQAKTLSGQIMQLSPHEDPNLSSSTLLKWASKAAVAAYTFSFVNYNTRLADIRPYFTDAGWADYQKSVAAIQKTITQNQLFVNSVVSGAPVISNQGELPGRGYTWRVQLPFLVTYQSAERATKKDFMVTVTIVRVPTWENPAGIGIDQFVMA